MSKIDYQALREAAEKATCGVWSLEYGEGRFDGDDALIHREATGYIPICRIEGAHPESGFDEDFQMEQQANAEFIAAAMGRWASEHDTLQAFIPPGQPWHNGFVESLHNRMRDELLEDNMFEDLNHARALIGAWSQRYNEEHPHSALGWLSPNQYARQWAQHH